MKDEGDIDRLGEVLGQHRYSFTCENELQIALASVLTDSSIPFEREKRLTARDRPDFQVGTTAIEVKVGGSLTEVTRQLHRYAQLQEVESILLVTSKARHRAVPRQMNGKRVEVLYLNPLSLL